MKGLSTWGMGSIEGMGDEEGIIMMNTRSMSKRDTLRVSAIITIILGMAMMMGTGMVVDGACASSGACCATCCSTRCDMVPSMGMR
ncbi:hypothetical protein KDH_74550 [Dictyobacter sp. S3.2.2.5]|uniref:4Fe-4S ferredoxin-type domain-containing protein n=1 Tax=Dictyobacter halimunensis TaxID=3026934 RepID=A0ABQ6G736_9CHLR|nr:hypothetical protein KDH_74550 [Dictyobacter sp. S3.2.2.5]